MNYRQVLVKLCFVLLTIQLFFIPNTQANGDCGQVLDNVHDLLEIERTDSFSQAAKEYICTHKERIIKESAHGGGSIELPGIIGVGGNGGSESFEQTIDKFCSDQSLSVSNASAYRMLSRLINPLVVEAWRDCITIVNMNLPRISLTKEVMAGNEITVRAKFNADEYTAHLKPIIESVYVENAVQNKIGEWKEGALLRMSGNIQSFTRIDMNKPVIMTLYTSIGGSQTLKIDPVKYPNEVGTLQVIWDEQYEAEGEPIEFSQIMPFWTPDKHNCAANNHAFNNYFLTYPNSSMNPGYLKQEDIQLECYNSVDGACRGWNKIHPFVQHGPNMIEVRWETWSRPTQWRVKAKYVPYVLKTRQKKSEVYNLSRGVPLKILLPALKAQKLPQLAWNGKFMPSNIKFLIKNSTGETQEIFLSQMIEDFALSFPEDVRSGSRQLSLEELKKMREYPITKWLNYVFPLTEKNSKGELRDVDIVDDGFLVNFNVNSLPR